MLAGQALGGLIGSMKATFDVGAWGLLVNVVVFALVTRFTPANSASRVAS